MHILSESIAGISEEKVTPRISELAIRNVRCFNSTQTARLRRITLLVGENSVGKSTFLGCYNAFSNLSNLIDLTSNYNPFDSPPFLMGDFDTVARTDKSNYTISGRYENHIHSAAQFCFERGDEGQPLESSVSFSYVDKEANESCKSIAIDKKKSKDKVQLLFQGPNFSFDLDWADISHLPIFTWLSRNVREGFLPYNADRVIFEKLRQSQVASDDIVAFGKFINFFRSEMPLPSRRCFHVEPLDPRVMPRQRIYSEPPFKVEDDKELALVNDAGTSLGLWDSVELQESVASGDIEVVINSASGSHNLLDVGYGVHSLLPIIRSIAAVNTPTTYLLQQPEVHVHPVVQAKFAQFMAQGPHDFIIETHSDHLVDRFRLCVMNKILQPEDLMILYFERHESGNETTIHNISVDSEGNILNPPVKYREFFLTETKNLLGLK